jgi:hypothetical protein
MFWKANTLLADHLFSPALLLAELVERDLIPFCNRTGSPESRIKSDKFL